MSADSFSEVISADVKLDQRGQIELTDSLAVNVNRVPAAALTLSLHLLLLKSTKRLIILKLVENEM